MQKWLPDAFASESASAAAVIHSEEAVFESASSGSNAEQTEQQRMFMSESGFSGPEAIMNHLTREERAQVFELVEQDITTDFEAREQELRTKLDEELKLVRQEFNDALETWSESLTQAMARHIKETSDAAARLAMQLAEKIVRSSVTSDSEILVRAIETTLFKMDSTKSITVNLNPEQAEWLESRTDLLQKLGITQVVADRRVETGGCLVKTGKREWDATIGAQLESLTELVEEMIATSDEPDFSLKENPDADSGLD